MKTVNYLGKKLEVLYDVDCAVVGGGTSGAIAGIQAARNGLQTLIIEKSINLGGTAVNALVCPMMPTNVIPLSLSQEITKRVNEKGYESCDGMSKCSWFNPIILSQTLEEMLLEVKGNVLYDAQLIDVIVQDFNITYLIIFCCQGMKAIKTKTCVDASGDGVLFRSANVSFNMGDENNNNQMTSLRFELGGIDINAYRAYLQSINDTFCPLEEGAFFESAMVGGKGFVLEPLFRKGVMDTILKEEDLRYYQCFTVPGKPGVMSFNCPHIPDFFNNTDAISRTTAIIKGHEMINRLSRFLKIYMPGFENSYVSHEATMLGIRESYRMNGKYILNEDDYVNRAKFADGVVRGDWYIDVHAKAGLVQKSKYEAGEYYEIPYRSLICKEIKNMIVAGRCISTTFLMQASIRIQPTLRDMGEIAGDACAYSIANSIDLNKIDGKVLRKYL